MRVALFAGVGLFVAAVGAMVTYPWWAAGIVESMVQRRAARAGVNVAFEGLELGHGRLVARSIRVTREGLAGELNDVEVAFTRAYPWSTRVDLRRVVSASGHVDADVEAVRRWAEELSLSGSEAIGGTASAPRSGRLIPAVLDLERLRLSISAGHDSSADGHRVTAMLTVHALPRQKRADLSLRNVAGAWGAQPALQVDAIDLTVATDATGSVQFPLRLVIQGGASSLTPQISVAGVSGDIELMDRSISSVGVRLAGSFADADRRASASGNQLWSLQGDVRRDMTAGKLLLDMKAFELGKIPQVLARLPLVGSDHATVGGHVEIAFADGRADIKGQVEVAGINISHPTLASDVVRDVRFSLDLSAQVDPAARRLTLHKFAIARKGVSLQLEGTIVHPPEAAQRRYKVRARMPKVPCQAVLEAIPRELIPSLVGFKLGGNFEIDTTVDVDYSDLDAATLGGSVALRRCRVRRAPPRVGARRLANGFSHRVEMRDGSERTVRLYPGSPSYTPLPQISPHVVAAVLTTEDGGFWRHRGFLTSQFGEALRRNLKAGKIRLGASTITMQTVKNVLLSHERTFSRKLQELFLTWHIERALSKDRIMEIYLNVIEFGPGIYGITHAARHYFGKRAGDLNSLEAAYLALMLPSPVRRHVHYCRDAMTRKFDTRLRRIHKFMHTRGHIDELEYLMWKDGTIYFSAEDRGNEGQCLAQIKRLLEGTHGQRALSGLLGGRSIPDDEYDPADGIFPNAAAETDASASDAPGVPAMLE
ncbi:MAG: biosynthetic peptidoglycan transglycosylase [Nannocystaceae bacterium]